MRVLFCGGGTAGHINPAIAVAEEVKRQDPGARILFIGRTGGRENKLIGKAGFEIKTLDIQGLKRSLSTENVKSFLNAIKARKVAAEIIKDFNPDVILGTGGYVCWPVITAGKKLGVPVAIHESNIYPGLTTRLISKKCDTVFLNHKETAEYLKKGINTLTVGNPLRSEFYESSKGAARKKIGIDQNEILIVSFGGSIGSEKINDVMLNIIENYSSKKSNIRHVHSTGERYFSNLKDEPKKYEKSGCKIVPFINNMPTLLRAADIAVCRSGAMTLSELAASEVSAVLIPSPNVTDNHQFKNAKHFSDKDAAILIEEKNLSAESLKIVLEKLENDKIGRKKKAKNIKAFSTPTSAKIITRELFLLKNGIKRAVF